MLDSFTGLDQRVAVSTAVVRWAAVSDQSAPRNEPEPRPEPKREPEASRVAVVLGYYNGNRFLGEQLASIANQTHCPLEVYVADDASSDPVPAAALAPLARKGVPVHLTVRTLTVGFNRNFLGALAAVPDRFEYFAFSDQDDIWHRDKLARALQVLDQAPADRPALYCARTIITDESGTADRGLSVTPARPPGFANALVQNIAAGNTIVVNRAARDLIVASAAGHEVVAYDWWCYLIISGVGGMVFFDPEPCLRYRQHSGNLIGANNGWRDRMARIAAVLAGRYKRWNDINLTALQGNRHRLTGENRIRMDHFATARRAHLIRRLGLFREAGIHRQQFLQNAMLQAALALGKV